jgi:hypothetical protein
MESVNNPEYDWFDIPNVLKDCNLAYGKKIVLIKKISEDKKLFIKFDDDTYLICSWSNYKDQLSFEGWIRKPEAIQLGFYTKEEYKKDLEKYEEYNAWYDLKNRKEIC